MILQLGERAFLVDAHQTAVSSHIRGKNGRKVTCNSRSLQHRALHPAWVRNFRTSRLR